MNEHRYNAFVPILLISISLLTAFIWQLVISSQQRSNLQNTLQRQDELVSRSREVQTNLERLLNDLLELAKKNERAQAVVQRYNIERQNPAEPPQQ